MPKSYTFSEHRKTCASYTKQHCNCKCYCLFISNGLKAAVLLHSSCHIIRHISYNDTYK